jgi:fatty acid desaturase
LVKRSNKWIFVSNLRDNKTMPNFIRLIIAAIVLGASVTLMVFGFWGWGIPLVFVSILVAVTYFYHEKMLIAQYFLRKDDMDKAGVWLKGISNYETQLFKGQHGYYNLLIGLIESRKAPLQSEKYFKRAINRRRCFDFD